MPSATTHAHHNHGGSDSGIQHKVAPWVEKLARLGYASKGVTYFLIGLLAGGAALGVGGKVSGSKGALASLAGEGAWGQVLLWIIGIGLLAYAGWQMFRAAADPEDEGSDIKGVAKRGFFVVSGVIHLLLAVWVFTHLLGSSGSGGSGSGSGGGGGTQGLVNDVLAWGMVGRMLVGVVAVAIAGFGVQQVVKAYQVKLSDELDLATMPAGGRRATIALGRAGLAARGVVLLVVGWFFATAAWQAQGSEAGGVDRAMQYLGSFGAVVLGLVALGLMAYGAYMGVKARYRRINVRG